MRKSSQPVYSMQVGACRLAPRTGKCDECRYGHSRPARSALGADVFRKSDRTDRDAWARRGRAARQARAARGTDPGTRRGSFAAGSSWSCGRAGGREVLRHGEEHNESDRPRTCVSRFPLPTGSSSGRPRESIWGPGKPVRSSSTLAARPSTGERPPSRSADRRAGRGGRYALRRSGPSRPYNGCPIAPIRRDVSGERGNRDGLGMSGMTFPQHRSRRTRTSFPRSP